MAIIIANWKMSKNVAQAKLLAENLRHLIESEPVKSEIVLCPSFPHILAVGNVVQRSSLKLGAQDCSLAESGAYTGDVSALMLQDIGCNYVILGHSERRTLHNESSDMIRQKAQVAHKHNLVTIICVGETEQQKNNNNTFAIIKEQLFQSLPLCINENNTIIAYEPIWAIGTGKNPISKEIEEIHNYIRQVVEEFGVKNGISFEKTLKIVYGGSVKVSNCKAILAVDSVDGLLVGGASLEAEEFFKILKQA